MTDMLRVVGAGLPRTGTYSLRVALERLLGGTCYHMSTLRERDYVDVPTFSAAACGERVDWPVFFKGCSAAVDWPTAAFWRELAGEYPRSLILLSERDSAEVWWRSADATVFANMRQLRAHLDDAEPLQRSWFEMNQAFMIAVFGPDWDDAEAAKSRYDRWNDEVRASVAAERLVEWRPGDGWAPLCEALAVPVPAEPFPHVNTADEFIQRVARRRGVWLGRG
ncbi:MAG: sulfotransferase family protein [Nocardioidaceae bacterium]